MLCIVYARIFWKMKNRIKHNTAKVDRLSIFIINFSWNALFNIVKTTQNRDNFAELYIKQKRNKMKHTPGFYKETKKNSDKIGNKTRHYKSQNLFTSKNKTEKLWAMSIY